MTYNVLMGTPRSWSHNGWYRSWPQSCLRMIDECLDLGLIIDGIGLGLGFGIKGLSLILDGLTNPSVLESRVLVVVSDS